MSEKDHGKRMLDDIKEYNLHRSWRLRRDRACLLVIDMQNYFVHPDGSSLLENGKDLVPPLKEFIGVCRENSIPVIFTRHMHHKDGKDVGILGEWWGDNIYEGTWESEIVDELRPEEGELVIHKNRYSAFRGTGLEEDLRKMGIEDVIIAGVMTNICCETTARDAFMRDLTVHFLADGNASANEEMHMSSLRNLAFGFAIVKTIAEIKWEIVGKLPPPSR
jgi:isochorismate hydrolase